MSSSRDWSEKILIFLWLLLSAYIGKGLAKWFGAHYNQEFRSSSAAKCKKGKFS